MLVPRVVSIDGVWNDLIVDGSKVAKFFSSDVPSSRLRIIFCRQNATVPIGACDSCFLMGFDRIPEEGPESELLDVKFGYDEEDLPVGYHILVAWRLPLFHFKSIPMSGIPMSIANETDLENCRAAFKKRRALSPAYC